MFLWKVLAFGLLAAVAADKTLQDFEDWVAFKEQFKKAYPRSEEERRFDIFVNTKKKIADHNLRFDQGLETYAMGINSYSDLTSAEWRKKFTRPIEQPELTGVEEPTKFASTKVPAQFDWRPYGILTPIKNQAQCASCWSFGATGALESQVALRTGRLISLSEQQLIDCSWAYGNNGCNGGNEFRAYEYIRDHGGIQAENSYPYEAVDYNGCRADRNKAVVQVKGYQFLSPRKNETALKNAIYNIGPMSVSLMATDNFQNYKYGVFYDPACENTESTNHNVLAIGYGTENGRDYFLIKNQYDTWWGEQGYAKLARNRNNNCNIASWPVYPLL